MLARWGGDAMKAASMDCGVAPTPTFSPKARQLGWYDAIAALVFGSSASVPVYAIRLDQLTACTFSTASMTSGPRPCWPRSTSIAHSNASATVPGLIDASNDGGDVGPAAANAVPASAASAANSATSF